MSDEVSAGVAAIADALRSRRPDGCFVVGVTGAVASGKSTFSAALLDAVRAWPDAPSAELVCTDGFLLPNAVIEARGFAARKGFPETFDVVAMGAALAAVRRGPTPFPGYSHVTYDIDPALTRTLAAPDVLIVEGLGLHLVRDAIDTLIYLDAEEANIETWFVARFLKLWAAAEHDHASYYARFRRLDAAGAADFAAMVWRAINLPNLREHILPVRTTADLIATKAADHAIVSVDVETVLNPRP
jgi:type I pantothenate kinase